MTWGLVEIILNTLDERAQEGVTWVCGTLVRGWEGQGWDRQQEEMALRLGRQVEPARGRIL